MSTISDTLQAGLEHHRAGRLREAEQAYRDVLSRHPRNAQALHLLGLIAFQAGHAEQAVGLLTAATELDANNASFHADLGEVLRVQGDVPKAIAACQRALEIQPEMADVHHCLGTLYKRQGDREQALASFRKTVELDPNHASGQSNLGNALRASGRLREAQACFERAVQLVPENADYYLGLGVCHYDQGRPLDAIACYQRAARLAPSNVKAEFNAALARLALGELADGWLGFELRNQFDELVRRRYALPFWSGQMPLAGALLVHAEQGFGDTLQFVRYVKLLTDRGVNVVLDAHEELASLLRQSGFNVCIDGVAPPECTHHIPLMSLPRVFGTTLANIPADVPYVAVDNALIAKWRDKLSGVRGLRVGIHWQGRPSYYNDRARSIALAEFQPLAETPGVQLVSLQKQQEGVAATEATGTVPLVDLADELVDFHETAAVMRNLDLVVSCDSAVVHLAGALNVPAWVALPVGSDWRWLQNRGDSPWYPAVRLFRQQALGEWTPVFAQIASELRQWKLPAARP